MIRINLLAPERPAQQKKAAKAAPGVPAAPGAFQAYLLLMVFAGGAAAVCAGLAYLKIARLKELDTQIAADEKRQRDLQAIKVQVDAFQKKKQVLENKITLIEQLKAKQKGPVHMLDEISKALPDFVWLTSMEEMGGKMTFAGESNSLTAVADFISALQRTGWFPVVDLVSTSEENNIIKFNLSASFVDPELAAKQAQAAQAAAQPAPPAPGKK